ncbi:hypothetical protein ACQPZX_41530 [Actinoplanes sp. CA-142083]|uniref:hypothetical protein n=1 Tax=Actinoplanes sp. CA-142083 TaxID=3239903 RepID=UPI003D9466B9
MKIVDLCPGCLTELPEDYPYDHVEIDRALADRPGLFTAMDRGQRAETVLAGLARGMSISRIAVHVRWNYAEIQALLPEGHPLSASQARRRSEQQIRELWAQDLSDSAIGLRIGQLPGTVGKVRKRIGLPSKFGPGGRRRKQVPA